MENWDNMRFVLALYRHRTMTSAAQALNTNVATVSRRIERTGQLLGAPVFVKDSTGWAPTDVALPLIRVAEEFDARLTADRNHRSVDEGRGLAATVQIAAPAFFNSMVLVPQVHRLLIDHPRLEVRIKNRAEAMGLGDNDIMLRAGRPDSGRVVARRMVTMTFRAYRSTQAQIRLPGWIDVESRTSTTTQKLLGAKLFTEPPSVTVSLFEQKLMLMRSTGMVAILADEVAAELPDMVPLDPAGASAAAEVWMVYHLTRRDDPGLRVVTDWIIDCFRSCRFGQSLTPEELFDLAS